MARTADRPRALAYGCRCSRARLSGILEGFSADDLDHMAGPFELPGDVQAGDYIEIGMLGAYGSAMRTGFNGFGAEAAVIVDDEPMASLYAPVERRAANGVSL